MGYLRATLIPLTPIWLHEVYDVRAQEASWNPTCGQPIQGLPGPFHPIMRGCLVDYWLSNSWGKRAGIYRRRRIKGG